MQRKPNLCQKDSGWGVQRRNQSALLRKDPSTIRQDQIKIQRGFR